MKTQLVEIKENTRLSVIEDTQYVLLFPNKKTDSEYIFELVFEQEGVEAEIIGLYTLDNGESLHLSTIARHIARNTKCNTKVKGVLGEHVTSAYIGKIIIEKSAQQTSSFLEDAVLVTGKNTKNRSDPVLEIEANDVQASHGATTGRIEDSQVYYLQSRGLTKEEAQQLIITGFFESLLSEISDETVRKKASSVIFS